MSLSSSAPAHQESAHKLCMIPGPIEFHDDVLAQMSTPATSHVDPSFIGEFGASIEMLRKIFKSAKGQPFIVAGSGTLGWDMVAANLVEPGENALVLNTGLFGDRFGECLQVYGAKVTHLHAPAIGAIPVHDEVVKAVKAQQYKVRVALGVRRSLAKRAAASSRQLYGPLLKMDISPITKRYEAARNRKSPTFVPVPRATLSSEWLHELGDLLDLDPIQRDYVECAVD
ncbi:hypothetical protein AMAG_20771 [Allomyces macrogynus ATCC 38327]|uniref:Aminotransferase class V domain-containing protein n=1 Tax=Allomyces macrogynus (strain ATCC 38327) TaxID=578462 RepID=A0A0L0TFL5_ALLM3|nr:hypothetical protein AMAG_20771 [Allomyces macrogynus ATCC 38327]|eukprot:KNE73409.1 hypothetical protein AMAG_20771 [Allomyces macrogynus ATCC 38327]